MSHFLRQKYVFIIISIALVLISTGVFMVGENHFFSDNMKAFVLNDEQIDSEHNEDFYRKLIENDTDEFLILETDVIIKFASTKWKIEMGYDGGEIMEQNFFSLVNAQDLPFIANSFIEVLDSGEINDDIGPFRLNNKNDENKLYMAKVIPIFNKDKKIILIGIVLRDISNPLGGDDEKKDLSNVNHNELENFITMAE
jgi:PAS domain S-box-containing protein